MRFLALVVLYKVPISGSETMRSLANSAANHELRAVVWDNSPEQAAESEIQWLSRNLPRCEYRHVPSNAPLSCVYNSIIREFFQGQICDYDALVLLDQDSIFGREFLDEVASAAVERPDIDLFLPLVMANNQLVSPARLYWFKGAHWKGKRNGPVKPRFRTAINSGMVIRSRYLAEKFPGYDERLQFYGTDNYFLQKYAETEPWLYVLNVEIRHELARDHQEDVKVKLWRHRDNMRSLRILNQRGWFRRTVCWLYCLLFSAKVALLYRDRRFLEEIGSIDGCET